MSETTIQDLNGVAETMLITLYIRAVESQRPDALIKDERAEALVRRLDQETLRKTTALTDDSTTVVMILKSRDFDRFTQDFLMRRPDAVVVHLGCGFDTRFERVDNGQVEWYDLDLPDVIGLRRQLVGGEGERHHFLAGSVLESIWLDAVSAHRQRPFLFLAEGVFMYLEEAEVKRLVVTLRDRFPGAELVFDAFSPFELWVGNLRLAISKLGTRAHWALRHGQEIEGWGDPSASLRAGGIRLLDEWGFLDRPEPRLDHIRWMRRISLLARALRVYHFQLGEPAR